MRKTGGKLKKQNIILKNFYDDRNNEVNHD